MRGALSLISIGILSLPYGGVAQAETAGAISATLSLGSRGAQVLLLQKELNRSPDTRVAAAGPGSPGNETSYFGLLTKTAVIRFQEKYARDILSPNGLSAGTGIVGPSTRAKLASMQSDLAKAALSASIEPDSLPVPPTPAALPAETASPAATPVAPSTNPKNVENIDAFFAALDAVAAKQGISLATVATLKEQAIIQLATPVDLRAEFLKQALSSQQSMTTLSDERLLAKIRRVVADIFRPAYARAATGTPFGGQLLFAMPCDAGVWNITISAFPPAYPVLIAYISGSQLYASSNIPITSWILGEYSPAPAAYCWIGPYPYPSEGLISPNVGSSLIQAPANL